MKQHVQQQFSINRVVVCSGVVLDINSDVVSGVVVYALVVDMGSDVVNVVFGSVDIGNDVDK